MVENNYEQATRLIHVAEAVSKLPVRVTWDDSLQVGAVLQKAIESAKTALTVGPDDPYVLRTAGSLIAQAGNKSEALVLLENAAKAAPHDSLALYSLAECLRTDKF
ncbi:MAG: hypothetical protein QX198_17105 [Methylococcaceae bacterium]